jgi:hypothetical protein
MKLELNDLDDLETACHSLTNRHSAITEAKPKWQVLFDGKSVSEWRGFRRETFPSKCWVIEEQSIKTVGGCDKSDQVDIVTKEKYRNFELEFEWRVAPGSKQWSHLS